MNLLPRRATIGICKTKPFRARRRVTALSITLVYALLNVLLKNSVRLSVWGCFPAKRWTSTHIFNPFLPGLEDIFSSLHHLWPAAPFLPLQPSVFIVRLYCDTAGVFISVTVKQMFFISWRRRLCAALLDSCETRNPDHINQRDCSVEITLDRQHPLKSLKMNLLKWGKFPLLPPHVNLQKSKGRL